jgi:hypothetical protein
MRRLLATLLVVGSALVLGAPPAPAQHGAGSAVGSTSARQMTEAAVAFLESLEPAQLERVTFAIDDEARSNWSNVPPQAHARPGLRFGDLNESQRIRLHNLLRASLSSQGYQKVAGVMRLDDINRTQQVAELRADSTAYSRALAESFGSRNYAVAVFADPRTDTSWGWLLQGHHLGASFTVAAGRVAFLPLFLGATPLTVEEPVETGWSALSHEVARGFELLQSLTESQRKAAVSGDEVPGDVLNGVGRKGRFTETQGLSASDMTPDQQRLLRILVEEYVRNADFDAAEEQLAAIGAAGWDKLWLSWRGSVDDPGEPFYYRVQGPRIVIECRNSSNHIHTIARDPANDYGEAWLGVTYTELITAAERSAAAREAGERQ